MQTYLYYRVYPKDKIYIKCLVRLDLLHAALCSVLTVRICVCRQVALLWFLDFVHTIMTCIANWVYLIQHFGDQAEADHITWCVLPSLGGGRV